MATTCLLSIASCVIENEQKWRDAEVQIQYDRMLGAIEKSIAQPDNYGLQIMRVLEEDRMTHVTQLRDIEMQQLLQDTRVYLSKV